MKKTIIILITFLAVLSSNAFSQGNCPGIDQGWAVEPYQDPNGCCIIFQVLPQTQNFPWLYWDVLDVTTNQTFNQTQDPSGTFNICYDNPGQYNVIIHYYDTNGGELCWTNTTVFVEEGCDTLPLCTINTPIGLSCVKKPNDIHELNWFAVLNAVSYEIEQIIFDPACCVSSSLPIYKLSQTITNSFTTSLVHNNNCFSWRVRAICQDGTKSDWSERRCSCEASKVTNEKSALQPKNGNSTKAGLLEIKTVPNPANDFVTITLNDPTGKVKLNQPELIIYDINGREVYRSNIALNESKRVDLSTFDTGVYIYKIIDNEQVLSTQKLMIK